MKNTKLITDINGITREKKITPAHPDYVVEMCSCFDGPDAVEVRQVNYSTNECLTCKKPFIETGVFARMVREGQKKLRLPTY